MGSVTISEYWIKKLEAWVETGIRKSKAEIVEEGLKSIQFSLDRAAADLDEAKTMVEQKLGLQE